MKYIVVVVMICLQQTAILKWSLAALSLKQYLLDTGIKTKKVTQQQLPREIF
jgi:hypothetical protein